MRTPSGVPLVLLLRDGRGRSLLLCVLPTVHIWRERALRLDSAVAVFANLPTNPANPVLLMGGPYFPEINEKVVEHVGQATRGKSSHPGSSEIRSPFHKSNPQRLLLI